MKSIRIISFCLVMALIHFNTFALSETTTPALSGASATSTSSKKIIIPPAVFQYDLDGGDEGCYSESGEYVIQTGSDTCHVYVPIILPSGSVISKITATVQAGASDADVWFYLRSVSAIDGTTESNLGLANVGSSTATQAKEIDFGGVTTRTMETGKAYYLAVSLEGEARIYAVTVTYR